MACNENVIKNIANEVTRNCQYENIIVEWEFVAYFVELLLLNPKYGRLFVKSINRNSLDYFVDECQAMIERGGASLSTLKIQFIMRSNYNTLKKVTDKRLEQVTTRVKPLLHEILDAAPEANDMAEMKKLHRKISVYILLYSGIGSPTVFMMIKESMAAMNSVFSLEDLGEMLKFSRLKRLAKINEVTKLTSGVRLFNRDCNLGGETIPNLPLELMNAGTTSLESLSNMLISTMQRVNTLTTAIEDRIAIDKESGIVIVNCVEGMTLRDYEDIFDLLILNRQHEIYIRRLLTDIQVLVLTSKDLDARYKDVLGRLHGVVKLRIVRVSQIFPLFINLWDVWDEMQNTMYLVTTISRLMGVLNDVAEHNKIPDTIGRMLEGKTVANDEKRMNAKQLGTPCESIKKLFATSQDLVQTMTGLPHETEYSVANLQETKHLAFLGICVMCLNVGALVPCNLTIGYIEHNRRFYGFSNLAMASKFAEDPDKYVNTVIQFARDHPQIINLLHMEKAVREVRDIKQLYKEFVPKTHVKEKNIQTEVNPMEEHFDSKYHWDLFEWKRRACEKTRLVNSCTHSTQTTHSHMRSTTHCQTTEPRDKNLQTMKEAGVNTIPNNFYIWGLRGELGDGQNVMDMRPKHEPKKSKARPLEIALCFSCGANPLKESSENSVADANSKSNVFYKGTV